jgi:hypothetical protein
MLGAMRATLPGLAAELGTDFEVFREAFEEGYRKGMVRHDADASSVWMPNFLRYNKPESPNVAKSWPAAWELLPECRLKFELAQCLRNFVKGLTEAFQKAFAEAFAKGWPNQEQEPEQEQEQKPEREPSVAVASVENESESPDSRHAPIRQLIQEEHFRKFRVTCQWDGSEGKTLDRVLSANPSWSEEELARMVRNRFESEGVAPDRPRRWLSNLGSYAAGAQDRYNKLKGSHGNGNGNGNPAERRQAGNIAAGKEAVAILERRMANQAVSRFGGSVQGIDNPGVSGDVR